MTIFRPFVILSIIILGLTSCTDETGQESNKTKEELLIGAWEYDYTVGYFKGEKTSIRGKDAKAPSVIEIFDKYRAHINEENQPIDNYHFASETSIITLNRDYILKHIDTQSMLLIENPVGEYGEGGYIGGGREFQYGDITVYGLVYIGSTDNIFNSMCSWGYYKDNESYIPCYFVSDETNNIISIYDEAYHFFRRK